MIGHNFIRKRPIKIRSQSTKRRATKEGANFKDQKPLRTLCVFILPSFKNRTKLLKGRVFFFFYSVSVLVTFFHWSTSIPRFQFHPYTCLLLRLQRLVTLRKIPVLCSLSNFYQSKSEFLYDLSLCSLIMYKVRIFGVFVWWFVLMTTIFIML